MLTMQQLYYLPELVLFKALKSSSKSPQNLELSFFEYKSCRALENISMRYLGFTNKRALFFS